MSSRSIYAPRPTTPRWVKIYAIVSFVLAFIPFVGLLNVVFAAFGLPIWGLVVMRGQGKAGLFVGAIFGSAALAAVMNVVYFVVGVIAF